MIKNITLGEEITITTKNKVGILADVSKMLANKGINIEAALGYEVGPIAKLLVITNANLVIVNELKKMKYKSVKETEVLLVDIENKPGALKIGLIAPDHLAHGFGQHKFELPPGLLLV